jgi:acyl-CoA dehydrogenase
VNFEFSEKVKDLQSRLQAFLGEYIYPKEQCNHGEVERNR